MINMLARFCLRQSGTISSLVFGFCARRAQKPNTYVEGSTMLPQAKSPPRNSCQHGQAPAAYFLTRHLSLSTSKILPCQQLDLRALLGWDDLAIGDNRGRQRVMGRAVEASADQ